MSDEQHRSEGVNDPPQAPPHPGWWPDPLGYADRRWWDGVRWADHTQGLRRRTHRRRVTPLQIAAGAGVVLILMLMGWAIGAERATMPQGSTTPSAGGEPDAYLACQDLVRQLLPAPEAARFPDVSDASIAERGQEWDVQADVEVADGAGAIERTPWLCTVRERGGTWDGEAELVE